MKLFKISYCRIMGDWLEVYTVADVVLFIRVVRKIAEQYYPDKIDVYKDVVSILSILMI